MNELMNFFFVANGRSTATRGNGRQGQNRFAVRYRTANRRRSGQSGALVQERWQPVHLHVSTFLQQQQQCVNVSAISCASFNFTVTIPPTPWRREWATPRAAAHETLMMVFYCVDT